MISYPYTRLMNANARVDMAAGLLLCSLETARSAGVPEEKLVFLHAATEANDSNFLSTRMEFHRSPAVRIAGARALELAGRAIEEIDHFDLYSCFPSSVQVAAAELAIPEGRPLTVTGGLTFGGGPLNSYGLHAVARMAEVVRRAPGLDRAGPRQRRLARQARHRHLLRRAARSMASATRTCSSRSMPSRCARRWSTGSGPVTLEAYTVAHQKGVASHRPCGVPHRRRSPHLGNAGAIPACCDAMMREEFCGRRGRIDGRGGLRVE